MATIRINHDKVVDPQEIMDLCPFNAIDYINGYLSINAACKMCRVCIKKDTRGVLEMVEDVRPQVDKEAWRGVAVYADHLDGEIYPVTFELLGKARELADRIGHPVYCLIAGHQIAKAAAELLHYGADEVFAYDRAELKNFRI